MRYPLACTLGLISLTAAHKAPFKNSNSLRARAVLLRKADMQLKDAQLFRQQAFIDGAWVDADNGQTIKVNKIGRASCRERVS